MSMERPSQTAIAFSLFAAAESAQAWSVYPTWYASVRAAAQPAPDARQRLVDMRAGYLPATAFATLMAAAAAVAGRSWLPVLASLVTSGVMLVSYEAALPPESRWRLDMGRLAAAPATEYALSIGV